MQRLEKKSILCYNLPVFVRPLRLTARILESGIQPEGAAKGCRVMPAAERKWCKNGVTAAIPNAEAPYKSRTIEGE